MIAQLDSRYIQARPGKTLVRLLSYGLFEGRPVTTRGRWINPLVLAWLRTASRLPRTRAVERPVFIIGTGRSGTTVLGMLLSLHREVGFLNEPKAVWHSLHSGEDVIGNYTRGPARFRLAAADATPEVIEAAHRILGAYLVMTGSRRVVDKYPELIFRVPFVRAIFPDARFLFVTRNGWDTCRSVAHWSERLGSGSGADRQDWWGVNGRKWQLLLDQVVAGEPLFGDGRSALARLDGETDRAAVEWVASMQEGLRLMRDLPEQVCRVRYEELASGDPLPALRRVLAFCGLSEDRAVLEYAKQTLVPATSAGALPLAPVVSAAFAATMQVLGYGSPPETGRLAS
jgi:sulfotransferase family protein